MTAGKQQSVLFLFGTLEIGGSETKFVALANRLLTRGRDVHVAYLRPPETLLRRLANVPAVHLGQRGKLSPAALRRLRAYVAEHGISAIVTVNFYPLCYAVPLRAMAGHAGPKVLASINTTDFYSRREARFMLLYRALLRRCDRIVFGAKRQRITWQDRYRLDGVRSAVIYNGIDTARFGPDALPNGQAEQRAALGIPAEAAVIVNVGQFRPEKAQHLLVRAAATLPADMNVHLLFVGDGAEREKLEHGIEQAGMRDRCHLVGTVDDVRPYLKAADVFALPSVAVETFSNAALEAAAMGLPVVMSDIGGAREMFAGQPACSCIPPGDVAALSSALEDMLRRSDEDAGLGASLRSVVVERYSTSAMDRAWEQVLWNDAAAHTAAECPA